MHPAVLPSHASLGPIRFVRRVAARLNSIGWFRAAGSLSFVTLLGLVPLATVAFAFVAQFPVFQDFLKVLETFLLAPPAAGVRRRRSSTSTSSCWPRARRASIGLSIVFVAITGVLVVDTIESEINEIWGIRRKRPIGRRILVYVVGITAGPVMVGARNLADPLDADGNRRRPCRCRRRSRTRYGASCPWRSRASWA